jgi:hypothetical protein
VQLAWWPWGTPRLIGVPGTYPDPKLKYGNADEQALEIAARWEQVFLTYDSTARSFDGDVLLSGVTVGGLDAKTKDIKVNSFSLGTTYWATKHVRLTAQWNMFHFPGDASENQALAPGAKATARNADAHVLHEFSARFGLSL